MRVGIQAKLAAKRATAPQEESVTVHDRSIGDMLREMRGLTEPQLQRIVELQHKRGIRFGEAAVALSLATSDDVLWALSQQFHYPYAPEGRRHRYPELVVASEPFGVQAEVMRDLCSQVAAEIRPHGEPSAALAVVSPDVGDGKTFLAANLAVAFSQVGGRTLLVDADLRSPRQHEVFGLDAREGLTSMLVGRASASVIQSVPDLPSLFVMPVGMIPPNPLELLQRPSFGFLLKELLNKFDHVIVDTPALSRGADARVIAPRCGVALAVGRKGVSRMASMQRVVRTMAGTRTRLLGLVMNERR